MAGRTPDEGRYSKISRRMWDDELFRQLSAPKPNAQTLWKRLLSGPELGCIPGLFAARQGGLADALRWPLPALQKCWKEIEVLEMAHADWTAGLVWVPNAIKHNEPEAPNVVISWRLALRELPECQLKRRAIDALRAHLKTKGDPWSRAFLMACGMPCGKPSAKPSGGPFDNQEQEQEQEQEQDSTTTAHGLPATDLAVRLVPKRAAPGGAPLRHDPLEESISFSLWFPSRELLAWATTIGLTEADVDATLIEARDGLRGRHDFDWFDLKVTRYFEVTAERKRRPAGAPRGQRRPSWRPPAVTVTGFEGIEEASDAVSG